MRDGVSSLPVSSATTLGVPSTPESSRAPVPGAVSWRIVVAIAAAATLLRAAYVVDGTNAGWIERGDAPHYHETAARIASGQELPLTAHWVPLYPIVLGGFYALFGGDWLVARLVNALLGGLTCVLLMRWTARSFDARSALAAGALYVVAPSAVAYSGHVMSENLTVPLVLAGSLALIACAEHPTVGRMAALGALFGALAMTHADTVLLFALALGWLAHEWRRRPRMAARGLAVALAAWAAIMTPWTVRNHRVFGRIIPLTTSAGPTLLDGNNDLATGGATGLLALPPQWQGYHGLREPEKDAATRKVAIGWMRAQGTGLLPHLVRKVHRLWWPQTAWVLRSPTPYPRLQRWMPPVLFPLILVAGWMGAVFAPPNRARVALWLVFIHVHVISLVFFGYDRYRLVFVTLWIAPAAWLLSGGLARSDPGAAPRRTWARVALLAGVALFLAPAWWDVLAGYAARIERAL